MLVQALQPVGSVRKGDWLDLPEPEAHTLTAAGAVRPITVALTAPGAKAGVPLLPGSWPLPPELDPGHTFGDWLGCIKAGDGARLAAEYRSFPVAFPDLPVEHKAGMTVQTGTAGGYLVPTEFLPRLMAAAYRAIVWPRAVVLPMAGASLEVPILNHTTPPATGTTAFSGGVVANWQEEASDLQESEPGFNRGLLSAHELVGFAALSNALLEDMARPLEALLLRVFGDALAWFLDYAFLRGNGVGKPLGVTECGAALAVDRQTAGSFTLQDAGKMLAKLPPRWNPRTTCWAVHPTVLEKLFQLTAAAGVAVTPTGTGEAPRLLLLGLPVEPTEALPALGTAKDVVLMDLGYYLVGNRQQVSIAYSNRDPAQFTRNRGTWRFVTRVDGQPWLCDKITLSDATTTVSPFVYLN